LRAATLRGVSPRRNRRRREVGPVGKPPAPTSADTVEDAYDGSWAVRQVVGTGSAKTYRCPGCDQEIRAVVPHVVAWPVDGLGGADDRRHWHTACWRARTRRRPNVQRSRDAPRHG